MSKKFSELPPKESLDSADYIPIVDSADSNPETQNKIVTFQTVRGYFTEDLDEFLEQAQTAESARVTAENARRSSETTRNNNESTRQSNETTRQANEATRQANETARENAETGYIQQAKSWAVGTNGVARAGDATDNAKYYAEQASASATSASASATSASASATTAGTAKDSAQASATQAAISAESVDAPALTKKILAAFPQESLSGSLLTLSDGADGIPAKTLTLNLSPHQSGSGDPSPENVRPISGYQSVTVTRAGKNILENGLVDATVHGVTYTKTADGNGITVSGTVENQNDVRVIQQNLVLPNGTYLLSGGTEHIRLRINRYDKDDTLINRITNTGGDTSFVVDDTVGHIYVGVNPYPTGETVDGTVYPMIRPAAFTDGEYEPYQGETYDIAIPTAAGTVYGGSLTVNDDGSGTLMVDRRFITLNGTETWTRSEIGEIGTSIGLIRLWTSVSGVLANQKPTLCNQLPTRNGQTWTTQSPCSCRTEIVERYEVVIDTAVYANAAAWKAHLAQTPLQAVFYTTPTTYALTASQVTTLLGDNTLWMDADGSIDLTYRADTQKYIDSRISTLNSNLAYIEDGTTASRAYSVGQYVLISGQLYKVTASIASGATFTVGTNVVATTVGTELTALN